MIDFHKLNQAALPHLPDILPGLLPGGRLDKNEYRTGDLSGGKGNSLSINCGTGQWNDFATGEKGGDVTNLVAASKGISQSEAAQVVSGLIGYSLDLVTSQSKRQNGTARRQPATKKPAKEEKESYVWQRAGKEKLEHVSKYLSGRAITIDPLPVCLRWNEYKDKKSGEMVNVIVAAVSKPSDKAVYAVQRLLVDLEDYTKPGAKMLGSCDGRGVWFDRERDMTELVVGEGIETVLSAMQATGENSVAALTTSGMKKLDIPEETEALYILVDSDPVRENAAKSMPGQRAAYIMAEKFEGSREGRKAILVFPDDTCWTDNPTKLDFNDLLTADPTGESIRERFNLAINFKDLEWVPPTNEALKETASSDSDSLVEQAMFDRYVFNAGANRIIDSWGQDTKDSTMLEQAFRLLHAGKFYRYEDADGNLKVMPLAKHWLMSENKKKVSALAYSPGKPMLFEGSDGRKYYNTFRMPYQQSPQLPTHEIEKLLVLWGKIMDTVFHEHKGYIEDWFAFCLQHPAERTGIMPVCISGVGLGKSLIMAIISRVIGYQNFSNGKILDVTGLGRSGTQWGDWIYNKKISCIEEIDPEGESGISYKVLDALKDIITNETLPLNLKGGRNGTFSVYSNIIGFSNHSDCMKIPFGDRRIYVVDSTGQANLTSGEYKEILDWMRDEQNIIAVYQYLLNREISKEFIPGQAKMTTAKKNMQADGRSLMQTAFDLVVAQYPCDLITCGELQLAVAQALKYLESGEEVAPLTAPGFNSDKQYNAILKSMTLLWGGGSRVRVQRLGQVKLNPTQVRVLRNKADWAGASNTEVKESMCVEIPMRWIMEDDEIPF